MVSHYLRANFTKQLAFHVILYITMCLVSRLSEDGSLRCSSTLLDKWDSFDLSIALLKGHIFQPNAPTTQSQPQRTAQECGWTAHAAHVSWYRTSNWSTQRLHQASKGYYGCMPKAQKREPLGSREVNLRRKYVWSESESIEILQ